MLYCVFRVPLLTPLRWKTCFCCWPKGQPSMLEHRRAAQTLADQENHTECELGPWKNAPAAWSPLRWHLNRNLAIVSAFPWRPLQSSSYLPRSINVVYTLWSVLLCLNWVPCSIRILISRPLRPLVVHSRFIISSGVFGGPYLQSLCF